VCVCVCGVGNSKVFFPLFRVRHKLWLCLIFNRGALSSNVNIILLLMLYIWDDGVYINESFLASRYNNIIGQKRREREKKMGIFG